MHQIWGYKYIGQYFLFIDLHFFYSRKSNSLQKKIKQILESYLNDDPFSGFDGYQMANDPSGLNIPEILRLRKLWKCYDMLDFGKYRYKTMGEDSHWLPGGFITNSKIQNVDYSKVPDNIPLKEMLLETHKSLYKPEYHLAKQ